MKSCRDCKYATQITEREYECNADQYDIDNKTCFAPRNLPDADIEAFKAVNRISRNSDEMSELME